MSYRKYIFLLCAVILLVPQICQAQKMVSPEVHDFINEAINSTRHYDMPILEDELEKAEDMVKICSKTEKKIDTLMNSIPERNLRDIRCVDHASLIITLRVKVLENFISMKNSTDEEDVSSYKTEMYKDWKWEKELRQEFFEEYGF